MGKKCFLVLVISIVTILTACGTNEVNNISNSDIFKDNNVVKLTYTSEAKISNGISEKNILSDCEKELDRIIHKNNSNLLEDKILYSKNNYDELGYEYMKNIGFNSNEYNDYAIVLSLQPNTVETYMVLKNDIDNNTNINILNEWKKQLKDIYIISDEENKDVLYELLDNANIKIDNNFIYFFITNDNTIIYKL